MSDQRLRQTLRTQLDDIQAKGLAKTERQLTSPQGPAITRQGTRSRQLLRQQLPRSGEPPDIVAAAGEGLRRYGYGMASVRFICGTQDIHKQTWKSAIARFLGKDDAILYSSCWDANGGLFETILGEEDTILSDELNHASIIDGIRLCKAKRFRYKNCDLADLEKRLAGSGRQPLPPDRHRRRLFDGRLAGAAPGICESGRPPRRHRHGRR